MLAEGSDEYNRLMTMLGIVEPGSPQDGTHFFTDPITEEPVVGTSEVWEFYNATVDAHPIHLHLVQFRILDRQRFTAMAVEKPMGTGNVLGAKLSNIVLRGAPKRVAPNEAGLKDTVVCPPGQVTRILVPFNREGEYVYHCHILSHEDHEMMRTYRVVKAPPAAI
jgi:spore coat protein A